MILRDTICISFSNSTVISEALNSSTPFSRFFKNSQLNESLLKKRPIVRLGVSGIESLTMTYFHTGIRTIIGADAFHCPVRDGKEWYHVAMVVKRSLLNG